VLYTNPQDPLDVSGDGVITALDALMIVNVLSDRTAAAPLLVTELAAGQPFLDVNADGAVTAWDALYIANYLNQPGSVGGEGEFQDAVAGSPPSLLPRGIPARPVEIDHSDGSAVDPARSSRGWLQERSAADDDRLFAEWQPWEDLIDELASLLG
jgi:hypothetical protein